MWRFSAFVLFLVLIASAGDNDALRKAFLPKATVAAAEGQELIPLTISLALWPDGAFSTGQPDVFAAANLSSAYELEDRRFVRGSSGDGEDGWTVGVVFESHTPALGPGGLDGEKPDLWDLAALASGEPLAVQPVLAASGEETAKPFSTSHGARPGREGEPAMDTYEAREAAVHIPMAAQAGEQENVGATPDAQIAAHVQSELIRLGCYDGPADNVWGASSSRALRKASRLANLRLQSTQPTAQTLMSLRSVSGEPCGGQRRDNGGDRQAAQSAKRQDRLPGQISSNAVGLQANGQADGNGAGQGANAGAQNSKSYLPPWMQGAETANVEAEAPPAERAEEPRHNRMATNKRSSPSRAARASARPNGGWRVRQRPRTEPTSHSWNFFLFH